MFLEFIPTTLQRCLRVLLNLSVQVPLKNHTTSAFVSKLSEYKRAPKNKATDAFLFKNTFFCSEFNEECDFEQNFDVFSAKRREDFYWSFQLRAKMLVKTEEVVAVGHHRWGPKL